MRLREMVRDCRRLLALWNTMRDFHRMCEKVGDCGRLKETVRDSGRLWDPVKYNDRRCQTV